MRVGVLGPLLVTDGERPVALAGAKQKALVAMLALHGGEVVSADRLIELLWGDDLPGGVANALQSRVSQTRRALGREALVLRANGYALAVGPDDVDALAFAKLAAEGRVALGRGEAAAAADTLRRALGLWRGEPLADVGDDGFFQLEARRLEELRWAALEDRVEADLALGRHRELASELTTLVEEQPLRERLRGQLMLALYRSGRQADALATFRQARAAFAEELGIDPGPELQALEVAILRQDAGLLPDRAAGTGPGAPPPRTRRLRRALTTFVGRDDDVRGIRERLATDRLVTLTGPGGAGKTRLAIEVAAAEQDRPDGGPGEVWLVELAPVADEAAVPDAIAAALDLAGDRTTDPRGASDALTRIAEHLGDRPALVVLDNCEHVVWAAAAAVERLLGDVPGLRALVTSREPLGVPGEVQWVVQPLAGADAVRLFLDRAEALRRHAPDELDAATVAEVCDRLDGLPLALELAAARVKALPIDQIAERLRDRFRLLTGGNRTALPRQQTLRALVDWSYELLFADERRTFRLLSVFAGRFELDQAEELCALAGMGPDDVVDIVGRLVDKSLVQVETTPDGHARYRLLETLKEYGRARLAEEGELDDARAWHATVLAGLVARAAPALFTGEEVVWLGRLSAVHDDLVAAIDRAHADGRADLALRMVDGLAWYWFLRGLWREGDAQVRRAAAVTDADPALRAAILRWRVHYAHEVDIDLSRALACAQEAVAVAAATGDPVVVALADVQLARSLLPLDRADEAVALLEPALAVFDRVGDRFWSGVCHWFLASHALGAGRLDEATAETDACLEDMRATGERWGILIGLLVAALTVESRGRGADAVPLYQEALRLAGEINFELAEAHTRVRLAGLLTGLGDVAEARVLCDDCLALGRRTGDVHLIAFAAWSLGRLLRRDGDLDGAEALELEALATMRVRGSTVEAHVLHELGWIAEARGDHAGARARHLEAGGDDEVSLAATLEGLAGASAGAGDPEAAARLLGAAEAARERQGAVLTDGARFDVDRVCDAIRSALGAERHAAAHAAGRALSPHDALALVGADA
jgi:predicted ATPase/DNA-binding SARP family transcriptional activator